MDMQRRCSAPKTRDLTWATFEPVPATRASARLVAPLGVKTGQLRFNVEPILRSASTAMRRLHHDRSPPSSVASSDSPLRARKLHNLTNGSLVAFLTQQHRAFDGLDDDVDENDDVNEHGDNDTDDALPITPSHSTTNEPRVTGAKRSRYLRESDRRAIIGRIDKGEKQSALAKEFGVTRAAICHINKNRVEILTRSARSDVHAAARHPKRGMYTTSRSNFYIHDDDHDDATTVAPRQQLMPVVNGRSVLPMVYEVRSLALTIHLTTLRASETSGRQFRAAADRAFRVLLEEALAAVPTRHVDVVASNGSTTQGVVADRPACAVFMGECGYPMLEAFRAIQPDSPTGFMTLDHGRDAHIGSPTRRRVTLRKMCAPADLRSHNIFLLDATCATALEASVAIQSLVDFGAQEASIFFVTLVISAAAVAEICEKFPTVHIVAVAVDPEVTSDEEVAPGVGNFQERYFNTTTIRQSDFGSNVDL